MPLCFPLLAGAFGAPDTLQYLPPARDDSLAHAQSEVDFRAPTSAIFGGASPPKARGFLPGAAVAPESWRPHALIGSVRRSFALWMLLCVRALFLRSIARRRWISHLFIVTFVDFLFQCGQCVLVDRDCFL